MGRPSNQSKIVHNNEYGSTRSIIGNLRTLRTNNARKKILSWKFSTMTRALVLLPAELLHGLYGSVEWVIHRIETSVRESEINFRAKVWSFLNTFTLSNEPNGLYRSQQCIVSAQTQHLLRRVWGWEWRCPVRGVRQKLHYTTSETATSDDSYWVVAVLYIW